jgi:hypothetical protein
MKIFSCLLIVILLSVLSCEHQEAKDERLAKQYCSSCHLFPKPSLLDKETWRKEVFPEMAFRMGIDKSQLNTIRFEDQYIIQRILPKEPMVGKEDWERIKAYYDRNAPDSLLVSDRIITDTVKQFLATVLRLPIAHHQLVTTITYDSIARKVYIGTRPGMLYRLSPQFEVEDSIQLGSAPSKIVVENDGHLTALVMGIMDPNEQALGHVSTIESPSKKLVAIIDSLQRPVDFQKADLNNDGADDYIFCNFGNFTGSLVAYRSVEGGKFRRYPLQPLAGARKILIKDFDGNGLLDIVALMTQADERIIILYNQGNFQFRLATLAKFDAVHGASYFEIADFNNDGKFDILYTNGDNADFSAILKPYHGVHILLNNGTNEFKESWFYPLHGASQARVLDFDQDGDLDIAVTSFFPDFKKHPDHSFVYFENTRKGYVPKITPLASRGRWITLDASDYDNDGDTDIILGSLAFPTLIPKDLFAKWTNDKISVLKLENKLK